MYDAVQPGLLRWLRRRMRDEVEAEDVCQEAFIRLLRELRAGRVPESPAAWVWRVAHNLLVSHARHARVVAKAPSPLGRTEQRRGPGGSDRRRPGSVRGRRARARVHVAR